MRARMSFARLALALLAVSGAPCAARSQPDAPTHPSAPQPEPIGPANPAFELGAAGEAPTGWGVPTAGYVAQLIAVGAPEGKLAAVLSRGGLRDEDVPSAPFGNLVQQIDAEQYRGKTVRYSAMVKLEKGDSPEARAQLWLRVDLTSKRVGFFDNMGDRPVTSDQWVRYTITGEVAPEAGAITFGMMLVGAKPGDDAARPARAFIDDAKLEVVADAALGNTPPAPLSERGVQNVMAFTRLVGYVRFFHPTDGAAKTDWDAFTIAGMEEVERAKDERELAATLTRLFSPIAPKLGVDVETSGFQHASPAQLLADCPAATKRIAWRHHGLGLTTGAQEHFLYRSKREERGVDEKTVELPAIGSGVFTPLPGGVKCWLPIALPDCDVTRASEPSTLRPSRPETWKPSARDRATRLAGVATAWNVLQHSYPYFDVYDIDWYASLEPALKKAATDADERAFGQTLQMLVAKLRDGHGFVGHASLGDPYTLPLAWEWAGDTLVVTAVPEVDEEAGKGGGDAGALATLKVGDVVTHVDGVAVGAVFASVVTRISGASDGWIRHRALGELAGRPAADPVELTVDGGSGGPRKIKLTPVGLGRAPKEPEPDKVTEIRPGIWYVDIDRIDDDDFNKAVATLATAKGVVFDLRGYPSRLSTCVLAHLINEQITCAQWHVPVMIYPDRGNMTFDFSNWPVLPVAPRLAGRAAFIIDGRAISYAETYMGMVENYRLAEIVGEPTAGTNGNVNAFQVPGGYHIGFTGMKVLKHDGSRHHGVGIRPTVTCSRTLEGIRAGKDELLEKAIEVVSKPVLSEPDAKKKP
ncbi:MAG: hypothetical protein H7Y88_04615 [Phycisphaerales bacterium]|nr:hypothetical protein [Phycisphaerales bacterium]